MTNLYIVKGEREARYAWYLIDGDTRGALGKRATLFALSFLPFLGFIATVAACYQMMQWGWTDAMEFTLIPLIAFILGLVLVIAPIFSALRYYGKHVAADVVARSNDLSELEAMARRM